MVRPEGFAERDKADLDAYWRRFPSERFLAGFTVCAACEALGRGQRRQADRDKQIEAQGGTVIRESRYWTVYQNPNI